MTTIDTQNELDFHADSRYIKFIKLRHIKSYEPELICLVLKKGGTVKKGSNIDENPYPCKNSKIYFKHCLSIR